MTDDFIIQQLKAALAREREIPPRERFADMVRRGVIDEEGRVLLPSATGPEDTSDTEESPTCPVEVIKEREHGFTPPMSSDPRPVL